MAQTWTSLGPRSMRVVCTGTETPAQPVKATGTVAFSSAAAGNTVTVRGMLFTATAAGGDNTGANFAVGSGGSANTTTGDNFAAAVNRYSTDLGVTAVNVTGTVTLTATIWGPLGHYPLARVGAPITLSGAAMAGGVAPVGVNLKDAGVVVAQAYATTAGQTVATGKYIWSWWNPTTNLYLPIWAMDDTGAAATRGGTLVGPSAGFGSPIMFSDGYLCVLPSGVTASGSSTVTIDMWVFSAGPGQVGVSL